MLRVLLWGDVVATVRKPKNTGASDRELLYLPYIALELQPRNRLVKQDYWRWTNKGRYWQGSRAPKGSAG